MDLIAGEYGWSDERILGLTLRRLRQIVAAIQRRIWLDDLNHRRIETAKLRAVCTYVAATMQLAEGERNPMLDAATDLDLGTGTENPHRTAGAPAAPAKGPAGPYARVPLDQLPDAPAAVRPGQPAALPDGLVPIPFDKLGSFLGGRQ